MLASRDQKLRPRRRIAVVLPRKQIFDVYRPISMETVIRTSAVHSKDDVVVICDAGAGDHGDIETITVKPGSTQVRNNAVVKELKRLKPDLVEVHQQMLTAIRIARRIDFAPVVLYRHASSRKPANPIQNWIYSKRYNLFDGIIFVSEFIRQEFLTNFPEYRGATHAVLNSINPDSWHAGTSDKEKLIVFAGRANAAKGLKELCSALPQILDQHPDWRVQICGFHWNVEAEWAASVTSPLNKYGARAIVHKDQPLSVIQTLLKKAAIAVVPTVTNEPFGLSALEAHIAGCALVSSGRGGLREVSGKNALFLDEVTPVNIANALAKLIQDDALRINLAKAGQDFALANHTAAGRSAELDTVREQLITAYRDKTQ